jgi:hypothetical protein
MTRTIPDLPDAATGRTFSRLLDWHLNNGTRPSGAPEKPGIRWSNEAFGNACGGTNEKTIRLWRSGKILPNDLPTIERELFGNNLAYVEWRNELRDAYDSARNARDRRARADNISDRTAASYEAREQWVILEGHASAIAEVRLHPPRVGNELNTFYVDATLFAGVAEYEFEGQTVLIGIKSAVLLLESPSYQPVQGSMVGQRSVGMEPSNFRRIPGGAEVIGPVDDRGRLVGDILGTEHVAIIEPVGDGSQPVTLSLVAGRRSFTAMVDGAEVPNSANQSPNKDAILNVLLHKVQEKDRLGRVVLAEARMQRRG